MILSKTCHIYISHSVCRTQFEAGKINSVLKLLSVRSSLAHHDIKQLFPFLVFSTLTETLTHSCAGMETMLLKIIFSQIFISSFIQINRTMFIGRGDECLSKFGYTEQLPYFCVIKQYNK